MNRKPKATIRDTSRGWNGYEGRRKVMEFQNIDAAEAWLYDKQYPKQDYGEAVNPETGEVAPDGQMWCQNLLSRKWFLQSDRTPYTCSPASETYWYS